MFSHRRVSDNPPSWLDLSRLDVQVAPESLDLKGHKAPWAQNRWLLVLIIGGGWVLPCVEGLVTCPLLSDV